MDLICVAVLAFVAGCGAARIIALPRCGRCNQYITHRGSVVNQYGAHLCAECWEKVTKEKI